MSNNQQHEEVVVEGSGLVTVSPEEQKEQETEAGFELRLKKTQSQLPAEQETEYSIQCSAECEGCARALKFFGL